LLARMDKVQMIDAFRAAFLYMRTLWVNDTHEAYFDGHSSGSRYAWRMAGKSGEPPGWESDDEVAESNADPHIEGDLEKISEQGEDAFSFIVEALERLEQEFTEEAFAQWSAFRGFCEEKLELETMKLLRAIMPQAVEYAQSLEERAARLEIEPDAKSVAEYRVVMDGTWTSYVRGATWQGK
jgi:hypothetical protein